MIYTRAFYDAVKTGVGVGFVNSNCKIDKNSGCLFGDFGPNHIDVVTDKSETQPTLYFKKDAVNDCADDINNKLETINTKQKSQEITC